MSGRRYAPVTGKPLKHTRNYSHPAEVGGYNFDKEVEDKYGDFFSLPDGDYGEQKERRMMLSDEI